MTHAMTFVAALARKAPVAAHRPWPRVVVDADIWRQAVLGIAAGEATLLGLWSDGEAVHLALVAEPATRAAGRQPALPRAPLPLRRRARTRRRCGWSAPSATCTAWSPKARPTRAAGSTTAAGACASRSARADRDPAAGDAYAFLTAEGPPLHQIPVGPVHAGIIEPGHFRFTANGETVVRLEERLGYVHKGIDAPDAAARRSSKAAQARRPRLRRQHGRLCASPSRARWRRRSGIEPPPRAVWLRALMAELERLANHLGDIGAICNDASFSLIHAHCGILREHVLRVADACFGHRLMMDRVVPGRRRGRPRQATAPSACAR